MPILGKKKILANSVEKIRTQQTEIIKIKNRDKGNYTLNLNGKKIAKKKTYK